MVFDEKTAGEATISSIFSRRPSLVDIAKACGVSRATVARALSGKGYVEEARRTEIQAMADKLGYRSSAIARALRTQRSATIGVLVPDIANPIFPEIIKGVDDVVSRDDQTILLCNTDENAEKQAALVRSLLGRQVDGLVMISQTMTPVLARLLENGPPSVFVNRQPTGVAHDYVGPDNEQSIDLLLDHLLGLGHKRIGYISGPLASSASVARLEQFRGVMARRGIAVDDSLIVHGNYDIEAGRVGGKALLARRDRPSAVMAANDYAALGVIEEAQALGLHVPDGLSVTGFDDAFGLDSHFRYPLLVQGLTTIDQPKRQIGREAGRLLLERMAAPDGPDRTIVLPTTLKVRDTTGRAE